MNNQERLPAGVSEDPDHPGWYSWGDFPEGSFAGSTGKLLFKPEGEGFRVLELAPGLTLDEARAATGAPLAA